MASKTSPTGAPAAEHHPFQAEMQQLLHIIVHSLYSEREVFLRELISNASDALNKLRFRTLTDNAVRDPDAPLEITLAVESEPPALIISDTGIGMTHDELINSLGTIARSGTLEFVKNLSSAAPEQRMEMIGQFGVGFYAVFMVAQEVIVDTCPADPSEPAWQWRSDGSGEFTLTPSQRTARGTSIRVLLKEDQAEFRNPARVEEIVKRYSNFIPQPIRLDGRQLNAQEAIWSLDPAAVSAESYHEFYKYVSHDVDDPMRTLHLSIDAPVQYKALLFIPKALTNEVLYSPGATGLRLYASKVLIQERTEALLPPYLRFMRGVVDSEDLPLNVSREMVQNNPLVTRLRKSLTGRILRDLGQLAEQDAEGYKAFWRQYGKVLKEGLTGEAEQRERLLELLRCESSSTAAGEFTTLAEYVGRMGEGQREIYYFTGPSRRAIEHNPHLEYFRKNDLEVLFLYDPVDDFVMAGLGEYEGKRFVSIDEAKLADLQDEAAPTDALPEDELKPVLEFIKQTLGDQVTEVRASKRLVDSPACLVSPEGMPGNLQKLMRQLNRDFKGMPKILEINPGHALTRHMAHILKADAQAPMLKELAEQLLENCLLVEGLLEQPERMVDRIQSLMTRAASREAEAITPQAG